MAGLAVKLAKKKDKYRHARLEKQRQQNMALLQQFMAEPEAPKPAPIIQAPERPKPSLREFKIGPGPPPAPAVVMNPGFPEPPRPAVGPKPRPVNPLVAAQKVERTMAPKQPYGAIEKAFGGATKAKPGVLGRAARGAGKWGAGAVIAGLGIGGATAGVAGARKLYNALTYKGDYENMLKQSPEIRNFDAKEVKARFDTLRRFNPEMSKDPLVAGSWIKQTIEYPVVTPSTLRDVVQPGTGTRAVDIGKILPTIKAETLFD